MVIYLQLRAVITAGVPRFVGKAASTPAPMKNVKVIQNRVPQGLHRKCSLMKPIHVVVVGAGPVGVVARLRPHRKVLKLPY
jgi:hypothetical protein